MDWSAIEQSMIAAAESVIGAAWPAIKNGATAGIKALSTIAQAITASTDMVEDEKKQLMSEYKQSLQNTITAYAAIAEAVIQDAISAAIGALTSAVPALAAFV